MRIPRIFHPQPLQAGTTVELTANAATHVGRVLRLQAGDALVLFDNSGMDFPGRIRHVARGRVQVEVQAPQPGIAESPLRITLVQAISRGERMDYTLQKAVELGVHRIVPVFSERSLVQLKGERSDKKLAHWQGVIESACEQSGRSRLPELSPALPLAQGLESLPASSLRLILLPEAQQGPAELAYAGQEITLLIGPEGGFSPTEVELAQTRGFTGMRLGPRVLRTETAAVVAISVLQGLWGDLR